MQSDLELLRRYVTDGSEEAYTEFVQRHLNFVYATALRQVGGDAHHAADVAQGVFIAVARQPKKLLGVRELTAWLHTMTRNVARNLVRAERRRQTREHKAYTMQELSKGGSPPLAADEVRPVIDDALAKLSQRDREAVLLRYFEGKAYPEIGVQLSLSPDAARLRIERALDKMRLSLLRRGVVSTSAALAVLCTSQAAVIAPPGLAGSIAGASLASVAASGAGLPFLNCLSMTKFQVALFSVVVFTGALGVWLEHRTRLELSEELALVRREISEIPRLRNENIRLAAATSPSTSPDDNPELIGLRREAATWKKRLDDANAEVALSPGLVPAARWNNVGQATPGNSFETLHWAMDVIDVRALGSLVTLEPGERAIALKVFGSLPEQFRRQFELTTPEEMVGFACAMREHLAGAEVTAFTLKNDDEIAVKALVQRINNVEIGPGGSWTNYVFRQIGNEWKWVITPWQLEAAQREIVRELSPL